MGLEFTEKELPYLVFLQLFPLNNTPESAFSAPSEKVPVGLVEGKTKSSESKQNSANGIAVSSEEKPSAVIFVFFIKDPCRYNTRVVIPKKFKPMAAHYFIKNIFKQISINITHQKSYKI